MQKTITVDGLDTPVIISRRKGARSLRLSIKSDGEVRFSVPHGVPEFMAKKFLATKIDWIKEHQQLDAVLIDQAHIGKNHTLHIIRTESARSHSKVTDTAIIVHVPVKHSLQSAEAQKILSKACEKALLQESEKLLPQRLNTLSTKYDIPYTSCTVKKLKSRWGACDNLNNISLNTYLIQLDWRLIDYVMLHELAHTKHHHHQKSFWDLVANICPGYKDLRKELKTKKTSIVPTSY
jgi:predicted metal-dependent hydrolase